MSVAYERYVADRFDTLADRFKAAVATDDVRLRAVSTALRGYPKSRRGDHSGPLPPGGGGPGIGGSRPSPKGPTPSPQPSPARGEGVRESAPDLLGQCLRGLSPSTTRQRVALRLL